MKVDPSYLTSQVNELHTRFYEGLRDLPKATGLQRSFIMDDMKDLLDQALAIRDKYLDDLNGQARIKIIHMTGRSMKDFIALSGINTHKQNLITTF